MPPEALQTPWDHVSIGNPSPTKPQPVLPPSQMRIQSDDATKRRCHMSPSASSSVTWRTSVTRQPLRLDSLRRLGSPRLVLLGWRPVPLTPALRPLHQHPDTGTGRRSLGGWPRWMQREGEPAGGRRSPRPPLAVVAPKTWKLSGLSVTESESCPHPLLPASTLGSGWSPPSKTWSCRRPVGQLHR